MRSRLVYYMQDKRTPQERMSNIRVVYGSKNAKSITIGGIWCKICKKSSHDPYHCMMMQKYQTVSKSSYCTFCKLAGHDDKDCKTIELMQERTSDAYRVQVEMMTGKPMSQFNSIPVPYNIAQQLYNNT